MQNTSREENHDLVKIYWTIILQFFSGLETSALKTWCIYLSLQISDLKIFRSWTGLFLLFLKLILAWWCHYICVCVYTCRYSKRGTASWHLVTIAWKKWQNWLLSFKIFFYVRNWKQCEGVVIKPHGLFPFILNNCLYLKMLLITGKGQKVSF